MKQPVCQTINFPPLTFDQFLGNLFPSVSAVGVFCAENVGDVNHHQCVQNKTATRQFLLLLFYEKRVSFSCCCWSLPCLLVAVETTQRAERALPDSCQPICPYCWLLYFRLGKFAAITKLRKKNGAVVVAIYTVQRDRTITGSTQRWVY